MKTLLKSSILSLILLASVQSFARVRVGFDIGVNIGAPPAPHEIIYERPYADAIWAPGYYNHVGYRYVWVPGYWRRPAYYRGGGWGHERFEHRDWDRHDRGGDRDHRDEGRGRGNSDHREGRIR